MNDIRYALRSLAKTPGFTVVIILTLALGIGANSALFSALDRALLRPLPYPQGERLLLVQSTTKRGGVNSPSYPDFLDLKKSARCFEAISGSYVVPANLVGKDLGDRVQTAFTDAGFLRVFGARLAAGRNFAEADVLPGSAPTALLAFDTWQKRFGGAADVVGRQVSLAGKSVTIIGILHETFRYHRRAEFFVPLAPFARGYFMDLRSSHYGDFEVIGRLSNGSSIETARAELATLAAGLEKTYPDSNAGVGVRLTALRQRLAGGSRDTLYLLFGAVGMVLLIACVNVANMLLGRACAREKEIAVRVALGASRFAIVRQLLTESLMLSCAGGLVGVLAAEWFGKALDSLVPFGIRTLGSSGAAFTDSRVLLFSFGVAVVTGVAFGLVPAWRLSRTSPHEALTVRSGSAQSRIAGMRIGDLLVMGEIALAAMLLIGGGLLMRSLWTLQKTTLGFEPARLITLRIATPFTRFGSDWTRTQMFYEQAAEVVQRVPGVESVGIVNNLSFSGANNVITFYLPDRPLPASGEFPSVLNKSVDPEYFRTLGIPFVSGRVFERTENRPPIPAGSTDMGAVLKAYRDFVVDGVVTQSFARRYWPGADAVGKSFRLGTPDTSFGTVRIVGVVADSSHYSLGQQNLEEIYLSFRHWAPPVDFGLVIKTRGAPAALIPTIRAKLNEFTLDPVYDVRLQTERIDETIRDRRFNSGLFASFALVAVALAMIGIYGVVSFSVLQRTREIGVRMALGADRDRVLAEVLGRGLRLFVPGIGLGLVAAWLVSRVVRNQLYGVGANDPATYAFAALALGVAALLACLIPARRATRVDPAEALRAE